MPSVWSATSCWLAILTADQDDCQNHGQGSRVLQYWLALLRTQASSLPSLRYLRTEYLGLTRCHPIFTTCGSSPWEVEKATTQARLLSGRYRMEALS